MKTLILSLFFFNFNNLFAAEQTKAVQTVFSNETELSLFVLGGNIEQEVYNLITTNVFDFKVYKISLGGHYTLGTYAEVINVRNWDLNLRFDKSMSIKFALFIGEKYEGDEYIGFVKRFNTDIGVRYQILDSIMTKFAIDLGYRNTIEHTTSKNKSFDHKLRLYFFNENKHNKILITKFWIEYLPNFTRTEDWELNLGPSLIMQISTLMSLKMGLEVNYKNKPAIPTNKKQDYKSTVSLLAKF